MEAQSPETGKSSWLYSLISLFCALAVWLASITPVCEHLPLIPFLISLSLLTLTSLYFGIRSLAVRPKRRSGFVRYSLAVVAAILCMLFAAAVAHDIWFNRTSESATSPTEVRLQGAMLAVEQATRSQDDQTAKSFLGAALYRYGPAVVRSAVYNSSSRWQQHRLFFLLSELTPDKTWKEEFLLSSKSAAATAVETFDDLSH